LPEDPLAEAANDTADLVLLVPFAALATVGLSSTVGHSQELSPVAEQ